jgi:MEMO1 family protein
MRVRRRSLPPGWYPGTPAETLRAIQEMAPPPTAPAGACVAGVVPHAGWGFSGAVALEVLSRLASSIDTMVIIGGHLGPSDGILCAFEDAYETPLGSIPADLELLSRLREAVPMEEDRHADNTVEVQLPFLRHLAPHARCLGLRAPPSDDAQALGRGIAAAARSLGRRVAVAGSTDLTHYGPSYGFSPMGAGEQAHAWVRDVNDRRLIESLCAMNAEAALELALRERSACSVGGAVAALAFARELGATSGALVRYLTSLDMHPSESFVGYAGIVYR